MTMLRLATAPGLASASPDGPGLADIVRGLDEAHGGRWSFQVVSHELRRRKVVVLGELEIGGQVRQQFGAAHIQGVSFGEAARSAALDALVQCAGLFRAASDERRGESHPPAPLRKRLDQVRDAIERLPGGQQAFREVLRGFQVRRQEQIPEDDLPEAISRCEQIYRVPPPLSANGQASHS